MFGWNETVWFSIFIGAALKSTAVLGVAWFLAFLVRGRSAAARHLVWTAAAAAVLALPLLSISLPALRMPEVSGLLPTSAVVMFQANASGSPVVGTAKSASHVVASTSPTPAPWRPDWRL